MTGSPQEPTTQSSLVGRKRCRRNAIKPNSLESDLLREFAVTHQMGGVRVSVSECVSVSVTEVEASASISKQTHSDDDSDGGSEEDSPSIDRSSSAEVEEVDSPSSRYSSFISSSVPSCVPEANNESSASPLERETIDREEEEEERGSKKKRVDISLSKADNRDEQ